MKKFLILVVIISCLFIFIYGSLKMFFIVTRFDFDKVERISYEEVFMQKEDCYFVYYYIDKEPLTDDDISSVYDLNKEYGDSCPIYVVDMNLMDNQKYIKIDGNDDYQNWENYLDVNIYKFPTLIKFENNDIVEFKN